MKQFKTESKVEVILVWKAVGKGRVNNMKKGSIKQADLEKFKLYNNNHTNIVLFILFFFDFKNNIWFL